MKTLILLFLAPFCLNLYSQIQAPKTPTFNGATTVSPYGNHASTIIQQQNRAAMKAMGYTPPPTQASIQAKLKAERQANYQRELTHQEKQRQRVHAMINENKSYRTTSKNTYAEFGKFRFSNLNSKLYKKHKPYYDKAFNEFDKMLKGEKPLSVKDAIYHSENAFFGGKLSYDKYNEQINHYKHLIGIVAKKYQLNLSNNLALQFAIQKLYQDTIYDAKSNSYNYPLKYDFNDFNGDEDYSQLFVSKLMSSGRGQCHSLPLLYKILSDEFNGETYLAYAPSHSYIQFKDDKNRFVNFETTNGYLTSNNFVYNSGMIKAEAIQNKIYTKEVATKQLIAQLLAELATMYTHQLGYDDFTEKMASTTLTYYPNNVTAHIERSNLQTAKLDKDLFNINYPSYEKLQQDYPKEYKSLDMVRAMYDYIDELGYAQMKKEKYDEWLKKQNEEDQQIRIQLNFNKFVD